MIYFGQNENGDKMEEFKVGDVVRLKSGGPLMTIESIKDEDLNCIWFVNNEVRSNYFSKLIIEKDGFL